MDSNQWPKKAKYEKFRIKIEDPSFFDKVQKLESLNVSMKLYTKI